MADKPLTSKIEALENSIESLESRNAFQDDIIDKLNVELTIHQDDIANLKHQLQVIANRMKENTPNEAGAQEIEPPPPHY
jgi:SlyX protein